MKKFFTLKTLALVAGMLLAGLGGVLLLLMWMIERKQVDSKTQ